MFEAKYNIKWEMLTCAFKVHVKNFTNRNYVSKIVLIYCSKCLILIFFQLIFTINGMKVMLNMCPCAPQVNMTHIKYIKILALQNKNDQLFFKHMK